MSNSAKSSGEVQASVLAAHDGRTDTVPLRADRFQRPESYTATLQRQNATLHGEVADLHGQVRDLQLALVIEKALGAMNSRVRRPPSPSPTVTVTPTKEPP